MFDSANMDDAGLGEQFVVKTKHPSRRFGYFTMANLFAAIALLSLWCALSVGDRGLVPTEYEHDFGNIRQGVSAKVEFGLTNRTNQRVKIIGVHAQCECSNHSLSADDLAPSTAAKLNVEWKIKGRRGRSETQILVRYKRADGSGDSFQLSLTANVLPDYNVEPAELAIDPTRRESQLLRISTNRQNDFSILKAYSPVRAIQSRILPDKRQVAVSLDPRVWANNHAERTSTDKSTSFLVIETDSPNEPMHYVKLTILSQ
jgi:Protein of unknown function (DUF1573)